MSNEECQTSQMHFLKGSGTVNVIDWETVGPWIMRWSKDDTIVQNVEHKPTGNVANVPARVFISHDFQVWQPWSDKYASAKLEPVEHVFSTLFSADTGPKACTYYEGASKEFADFVDGASEVAPSGFSSTSQWCRWQD